MDVGDRHMQAAILESYRSSRPSAASYQRQPSSSYYLRNSSGQRPQTSSRPPGFGRRNQLAREGIRDGVNSRARGLSETSIHDIGSGKGGKAFIAGSTARPSRPQSRALGGGYGGGGSDLGGAGGQPSMENLLSEFRQQVRVAADPGGGGGGGGGGRARQPGGGGDLAGRRPWGYNGGGGGAATSPRSRCVSRSGDWDRCFPPLQTDGGGQQGAGQASGGPGPQLLGRRSRPTTAAARLPPGDAAGGGGGLRRRRPGGSPPPAADDGEGGRRGGGGGGGGGGGRRRRPARVRPGAADGPRHRLFGGWWQRCEDAAGSLAQMGLHTVVESCGRRTYLAEWGPQGGGASALAAALQGPRVGYDLAAQVKCARRQADPPTQPVWRVYLVFALRSPADFALAAANVNDRTWTLETFRGGGGGGGGGGSPEHQVVARAADEALRPNVFLDVLLKIRGNTVTLECNGNVIFASVPIPGPPEEDHEEEPLPTGGGGGGGGGSARRLLESSSEEGGLPAAAGGGGGQGGGGAAGEGGAAAAAAAGDGEGGGGPRGAAAAAAAYQLRGNVGLLACQSKCMVRSWQLRPNAEPVAERPLRRHQPYHGNDDPALVAQVERDVIERGLGVTFADVAALEAPKRLLREAVVLPMLVPELFTGIREPWAGVLLFGPPGTGKTLLAKAAAGMHGATFFNVSTAGLVSKYRGESEKLLRCLFNLARHRAPAVVFLDEIDALVSHRRAEGEHEASRRLKTELFVQMDGVASRRRRVAPPAAAAQGPRPSGGEKGEGPAGGGGGAEEGDDDEEGATHIPPPVTVLATTNCPWDLDEALLRRLEKRVLVPLPDRPARRKLFELGVAQTPAAADVDPDVLAEATPGYSGADIALVCRDALMAPVRRLVADKTPQQLQEMKANGQIAEPPPVCMADFDAAIANTRPSVASTDLKKFDDWNKLFGSTI